MAKNTRLATTVTARYTPSVGAVDAFYLDGRISGRREEQFADITLDREDRGSFFAVYASSHGSRSETHNDDGNRQYLDQIANDLKKNNRRNIDYEINELAECVVNVSGRLTLADAAIRQPYFSGVIIKDGEMAAITLGRGSAYLYRDETLYPLTQDEFPLESIDGNGRKVSNMNDFAAGIAGTIRYSNIAQLKQDDCIIMCNKEVMEAVGQKQMLRILDVSEDQSEAAGMILDLAATENPHVSMQFMIGFVEDITTVDRLGRGTLAKGFTSRTTDRTGQKNSGTLFAGFEEPYKAPVASSASASAKLEDDMADTKPALDLNDAAGLIAAAEAASYQKMQANESNHSNEFDHTASRTDYYKDLSPDEAIDYSGFSAVPDDAAPLYAAETADQFEQDSPVYADDNWDTEATLAYAGGYKDNDRNKKLAVIALAAVAVILLFFIIKTLVSGEEPGSGSDNGLSLPVYNSSESDSSESELVTEDAAVSSESVGDTSEPSEEPSDSSSDAASESVGGESSETSTTAATSTEAATTAPTTSATTAPVTSATTIEPTTTAPTTTAPTTVATTAPTTAAPTEPAASETYVVQPGDTLYLIALKIYNDPSYIDAIGAANGFDPETQFIEEGQTLILPAATE